MVSKNNVLNIVKHYNGKFNFMFYNMFFLHHDKKNGSIALLSLKNDLVLAATNLPMKYVVRNQVE